MTLSEDRESIYCHVCKRWYNVLVTLQPIYTDDVLCINCSAHLGYTWDLPEFFGMQEMT